MSIHLDFLVVGSKASPGWKFGNYGTKIAEARAIAPENGGRPRIVSETDFMDALASTSPTGAGSIDAKVLVCNYSFVAESRTAYDAEALERSLDRLRSECGCHVNVSGYAWRTHRDLFAPVDDGIKRPTDALLVHCRVVRQMTLDESATNWIEQVARAFESIPGVDGKLQWFERTEGTAGYARLLNEIPQSLRVSGL